MITPHEHYPNLAKQMSLKDLYFKREDLHPYGSHKGRSIPFMIDYYHERGDKKFAISSSGNAALAAAMHVRKINSTIGPGMLRSEPIFLDIFVGHNVNQKKLDKLKAISDEQIRILIKERPLQALLESTKEGYRSLRQSTDDIALIGYKSLAEELMTIPDIGSIFIGTSSGTTAQALAQFFSRKEPAMVMHASATFPEASVTSADNQNKVQVHIVQTSSCHPICDAFENYDGNEEKSIADAIVDKTAIRKNHVTLSVQKSGGYGWFASNEDIETAIELTHKHAMLDISENSALSIVGAMHAAYRNYGLVGATVCIICGD